MRTILFISFLLLLWCGFSSFESTSVRPNGWYYVIDMEHDSLSADPIVTVKDFARIKLDSVSDSNEDNMAYDMKLLYQQILQEAGCKSEFGFTDEVGQGESTFTFWLIRGGLIGLLLVIMCFGFLKVRKIKKTVSG